jgi:hypothetical protein
MVDDGTYLMIVDGTKGYYYNMVTPGALTISVVNEKLERFGQQLGALLASPAHRERLEENGARVVGVGAARADGQVYLVVLLTDGAALRDAPP